MKIIDTMINRLDHFQRHHKLLGFTVAVIKKYGDDQAGQRAALLTYYGFLSLFPLLLLVTTLTDNLIGNYPGLEATIIHGLTNYFPLLGSQLSSHVHGLHNHGLALWTGILFTLYGARGVADAFRHGVQHVWLVPKSQQDGFPGSLFKSIGLIIIGGLGFLLASIVAGITATAGHGLAFKVMSVVINLLILFWLFMFLLNFSLPKHVTMKQTRAGAAAAAFGLVAMQLLGTYLLSRELKSLDALYSYFALALGLLFWIYLQAQILYYGVEIAIVNNMKLHPRSLTTRNPTEADKRLIELKSKP